jgi:hypothetical protein
MWGVNVSFPSFNDWRKENIFQNGPLSIDVQKAIKTDVFMAFCY